MLGLDDEGNLAPIVEVLVVANVDFLYFEPQVIDMRLGNDGPCSLPVDFVLVAQESVAPADDEAVVENGDDYEVVLLGLETLLGNHVGYQLAN